MGDEGTEFAAYPLVMLLDDDEDEEDARLVGGGSAFGGPIGLDLFDPRGPPPWAKSSSTGLS